MRAMPEPIFHARIAIPLAITIAVMSAFAWALNALSRAMEFSNFVIFGLALIAAIIGFSFACDLYTGARRSRPKP
jgi:hypothetical protein